MPSTTMALRQTTPRPGSITCALWLEAAVEIAAHRYYARARKWVQRPIGPDRSPL